MLPTERSSIAAALLSVLLLSACVGNDVTRPPDAPATLVVTANLAATAAVTVVVEVTAPDIMTPPVFNIPVNQTTGVASGMIAMPAGSNRTIAIGAYDAGGVKTHQGSVTVHVAGGANPTIALQLAPLTGDVAINTTIGSITVTVTCPLCIPPAAPAVAIGATITLNAVITGASGTVTWATRHPGIASVTSAGVVTGVAAGQTSIVATSHGAAGAATVTVRP